MSMMKVTAGGVDPGNYVATFAGVESQAADPTRKFGAGLRWKFCIESGPQAGQVASRITGLTPTTKNGAGKILRGLLNRDLQQGESIDPDQFIGKRYTIIVQAGPQGGSRVEVILPA